MALCDCPVGAPIGPTLAATCGGGPFMLFMGLLEVFLRSQCDIEDPCNRPKVCEMSSLNTNKFLFDKLQSFNYTCRSCRLELLWSTIMSTILSLSAGVPVAV